MQSTTSSTRTFITPAAGPETPADKQPRKLKRLLARNSLPWVVVAGLVLISGFLFMQYRTAQDKLQTGSSSKLIAQVQKMVVLPANETPTVATVVHADKLRSQTFFANAQDGDKVLVYDKEKQAILYRPSTNQIVTIAPVSVTPSNGSNLSTQ